MATLTNIDINTRSMNGLITISDGAGSIIENGIISSTTYNADTINCNTLIAGTIISSIINDLIINRDPSSGLITLLGQYVDVNNLLSNFNFNVTTRLFQLYRDNATLLNQYILNIDTSTGDISINSDNLSVIGSQVFLTATEDLHFSGTDTIDLSSPAITLTNSSVSFPNSLVSFNSNLPTSTVTPSLDSHLITRTYGDSRYGQLASANAWTGNTNTFNSFLPTSTIATTTGGSQFITRAIGDGRFGQLAVANTWAENNIFTKGILPRTSLTDTNIQLSSNSMVNRQATSLNNVGIGLNTLIGDTLSTWYSTITGSQNIGIGNSALQQLCSGSNNIAIGYQAMQLSVLERGVGVSTQRNIAIGSFSQKTCGYSTDNITIGYNSLPNNAYGNGNVVIASNGGGGISNKNGCVIIGSNSCPTASENAIISIGESAMGASTGSTLACIAIGQQALYNCRTSGCLGIGYQALFNLTTGYDNQGIGYGSGAGCISGTFNQFIGRGTNTTKSDVINSVCVGYNAQTVADYEFVIGGNAGGYPHITLPEKIKINVNKNIGAVATHTIPWRSPENIIVDSATTTQINLPTASATTDIHIGAVFNIIRTNAATSNILILAYSAEKISYLDNTTTSFTLNSWERSISLVCVDKTASGINWTISNYAARVSLANDANKLQTITDSTNVNYPVAFTTINPVGTYSAVYANASLIYNPSTSILTVPNLNLTNKTNIQNIQSFGAVANASLSFGTNENVLITKTTTTSITLPTPIASNIGCTFNIYKTYTGTSIITVIAPSAQHILADGISSTTYNFGYNQTYLIVTCIADTGVITWTARGNNLFLARNDSSTITGTYTFSTNPIFNNNSIPSSAITGYGTTQQIVTNSSNVNYPVTFTTLSTGGSFNSVYGNASLTYNPSTSILSVPHITMDNLITNQVYRPFKSVLMYSNATVLPSLPTLYGLYLWAEANPSGSGDTIITLPQLQTYYDGCRITFRRLTHQVSPNFPRNLIIKTPNATFGGLNQLIKARDSTTTISMNTNYTLLDTSVSRLGVFATLQVSENVWYVVD
jgi:hypothetical protein